MNGLDKKVNVRFIVIILKQEIINRAFQRKQFNKEVATSDLKKSNPKSLLK